MPVQKFAKIRPEPEVDTDVNVSFLPHFVRICEDRNFLFDIAATAKRKR
jgi:hypothetical protein